jgi:integral membrane sensor domain MASE1
MIAPRGAADDLVGLPLIPRLVLLATILWFGNAIAAALRYPEIGSAVLFLPYAILTAALVFAPRRDWIWYFLVGCVAHALAMWPTWTWSWVLIADVANMVRAFLAAWLLRRCFDGPPRLSSIGSLTRFVAVAVVIAPAAGATIGAANVVLHAAPLTYGRVWVSWWRSNALTGLTLLPALMAAMTALVRPRPPVLRRRIAEGSLLVGGLAVMCALVFLQRDSSPWIRMLSRYGPLPLLIWAALRFGPGAASFAVTTVVVVAIWAADAVSGRSSRGRSLRAFSWRSCSCS